MNRFSRLAVRLIPFHLCLGMVGASFAQTPTAWGGAALVPTVNSLRKTDKISVGSNHVVAVLNDGTVVQTGAISGPPIPSGLTNPINVSAGNDFSLAVTSEGKIVGWGGIPSNRGRNLIPIGSDFRRVRAGTEHGAAIRADGTFVLWGKNTFGEADAPSDLKTVRQLTIGADFMVAIDSNGALRAWGRATGVTNGRLVHSVPAGSDFVDVNASPDGFHAVALREHGSVVAWGLDSHGQSSVPPQVSNPEDPRFKRAIRIAAGMFHSVALLEDGTTISWGANFARQLESPSQQEAFDKIFAGGFVTVGVTPKPTATLSFDASDLVGGSIHKLSGIVKLDKPADEDLTVALSSSAPGVASAPISIRVRKGETIGQFEVAHQVVPSVVTVRMQATQDVVVTRGAVRISPNRVQSVSTSVPTVLPGGSLKATVELSDEMTSAPIVVDLSSVSGVTLPATVTIPAGMKSATFDLQVDQSAKGGIYSVSAALAGKGRARNFNVANPPSISSVTVPTILWGNSLAQGRVNLSNKSPEDTVIQLSATNDHLSLPPTVTIPAGSLSVTFPIAINEVDSPLEEAYIRAEVGNSIHNRKVEVRPNSATALTLESSVVSANQSRVEATVALRTPVLADTFVVVSGLPGSVPSTVVIPAGSKSATFSVTVKPEHAGKINTIAVTKSGARRTARLQITP